MITFVTSHYPPTQRFMRKPIRFRNFLTLVALAACTMASAQNVGINATPGVPPTPDPDAILDIDVTGLAGTVPQPKRGLLIPRMTEAQRLAIPVVAADNGLLVYQTDTGSVNQPDNQRGFWYYSAAAPVGWIHLSVARTGWFINGNTVGSVTGAFAEHLGTANLSFNKNLVFRTVLAPADPAMQMGYALFDYESGYVGLGTPAPAVERLEVRGAIHLEKNTTPNVAVPAEGTIRYGTKNGLASSATNFNWHWGTDFDTLGTIRWSRLENAENLITPPQEYAKDTMDCTGGTGDAFRGALSPTPVTQTSAAPCNFYSPFGTNFTPTTAEGNYRVQYLYRYEELVAAGICFSPNANITDIAFYSLDQEKLDNPGPIPTTITGEIRGGASTDASLVALRYYGIGNVVPFMDSGIRTIPNGSVNGTFFALTVSPGWVNLNLGTPIVLAAGKDLVIDIVWSRNIATGLGPRVELEDPGFTCTKWILKTNQNGTPAARFILQDGPGYNGSSIGSHDRRPVTRFTGTVASPTIKRDSANYVQYDGGLMIGSPAWLAGATFHGAGTIGTERGVYDAGALLSDHVFDRYFDGAVRPEDAHAANGYAYVGLDKLRERLERDRHLPNMPSRSEWEAKGGASLGTVTTGLWETVEDQALYITQLEKDLRSLEEMAFGTDMSPQEAMRLIAEVQSSKRLSEAQKLHLIDALNEKATPKP